MSTFTTEELVAMIQQQKQVIDDLQAHQRKMESALDSTQQVVYQLVGGLFNQSTQKRRSILLAKMVSRQSESGENMEGETDPSGWGIWPTTRQGDVLEKRVNDMALTIAELERNQWLYKSYQSDMAASFEADFGRVYNEMDAMFEKVRDIREHLGSQLFDLREVVRIIGSGLFNMETQRGAWKTLRDTFVHDETFETMPEKTQESWSETTSKWDNLPTTRQGDECEARLDKIEAKMRMMARTLSSTQDC